MLKYTIILFLLIANFSGFSQARTIHVFVALCDNENQGIVKVPALIGNGQDAYNNLYWGAAYGVKNYLKNISEDWIYVKSLTSQNPIILDAVLFKHKTENVYLYAEAYDGKFIKNTTIDFFNSCSGKHEKNIQINDMTLQFGAKANLVAYIGHDGLMEFDLEDYNFGKNSIEQEVIILACVSKSYFGEYLKNTSAYPLVWTTGLMAPEAYTLAWACSAWAKNQSKEQIRIKAAEAYNHYQKCGINGAKRLLVGGW